MSSNNPFSNYDGSDHYNEQSQSQNAFDQFSAEDAVSQMYSQNSATVGYDADTFRVNNGAFASVREQSVLVKSMFFMCLALFISAITAFIGFAWGKNDPYAYIGTMIPAIIIELIVFGIATFAMKKDNFVISAIGYFAYSAISGFTLSVIFFNYQLGSIVTIFIITAVMFGALALYGFTTKADLTPLGSFLIMGLVGIVLVGVLNLFLGSEMISNIVAVVGVVVFAGLTAYDIQKMKQINIDRADSSELTVAMYCGLQLYLDFINLFLKLLRLFAKRND